MALWPCGPVALWPYGLWLIAWPIAYCTGTAADSGPPVAARDGRAAAARPRRRAATLPWRSSGRRCVSAPAAVPRNRCNSILVIAALYNIRAVLSQKEQTVGVPEYRNFHLHF